MKRRRSGPRAFGTAAELYHTRFGVYPSTDNVLLTAKLIDNSFAKGYKSGYRFVYRGNAEGWVCFANPLTHHETGHRYFYSGSNVGSVIYANPDGPAAPASSSPID